MPDTVSLIIWLIAGIAGAFAVHDLLKGFHLGPARALVAGAVGGVAGSQILQLLIPALRGFNMVPIVGQVIGAFASGAASTVAAGPVIRWYQSRRR